MEGKETRKRLVIKDRVWLYICTAETPTCGLFVQTQFWSGKSKGTKCQNNETRLIKKKEMKRVCRG
jgi:hypothetical protein